MSEFVKVTNVQDLDSLDQEAVVAGYLDGLRSAEEPRSDKCRGYWHGWRNAQIDRGRMPVDAEACQLVRSILGPRVGAH